MASSKKNLINNFKNTFDPTVADVLGDQIRNSHYEVLNEYDQDTLNRMSTNKIKLSNDTIRKIPHFSEFVPRRNPSLDVGMRSLPIQNMTILPNQINSSLDLLAQTDQLTIANTTKRENLPDGDLISSNDIDEPIDKFQGIAVPHIPQTEYSNPSAYFNNFLKNGRTEIIREYVSHINSIDRDLKQYPNPFNFLVRLAPNPEDNNASISRTFINTRYIKTIMTTLPRKYLINMKQIEPESDIVDLFTTFNTLKENQVIIDGKYVIIYPKIDIEKLLRTESKIEETKDNIKMKRIYDYMISEIISYTTYIPDVSIPINISYDCIKKSTQRVTQTVLVGKKTHNETIINEDKDPITFIGYSSNFYEIAKLHIDADKYTLMYVNDINDISQYSTDRTLSEAFNIFYPDTVCDNYIYAYGTYSNKIYKRSDLGNISRINLRLADSTGKTLSTNVKAQDMNTPNINSTICTCYIDQITGNLMRDFKCICNYIRHPRYNKFQTNIMLKFGIVETDFDKRPFN